MQTNSADTPTALVLKQIQASLRNVPARSLPLVSEFIELLQQGKPDELTANYDLWRAKQQITLAENGFDKRQVWERLEKQMDEMRENTARYMAETGMTEAELEAEIDLAIREVRAERRAALHQAQ